MTIVLILCPHASAFQFRLKPHFQLGLEARYNTMSAKQQHATQHSTAQHKYFVQPFKKTKMFIQHD